MNNIIQVINLDLDHTLKITDEQEVELESEAGEIDVDIPSYKKWSKYGNPKYEID